MWKKTPKRSDAKSQRTFSPRNESAPPLTASTTEPRGARRAEARAPGAERGGAVRANPRPPPAARRQRGLT
jgi:hypothetical protein